MKGKSLQSAGIFMGQATLSEVTWGGSLWGDSAEWLASCVCDFGAKLDPSRPRTFFRKKRPLWQSLGCTENLAMRTMKRDADSAYNQEAHSTGAVPQDSENISPHFCPCCLREDNGYTHANSIKKSPVNVREYHGMLRFIWLLHCSESFADEPWSPWLTWLHSAVSDTAG